MTNNDQLQLVTFEQAKNLKKLGFYFATNAYYIPGACLCERKYSMLSNHNRREHVMSAPKVPLALKWVRDVKGIRLGVQFRYTGYYGHFNETDDRANIIVLNGCDTYEQAESALLDAVIEELKKARKE